MWLSAGTVDITPDTPMPLAGFAVRLEPYEGIRAPLAAQIFALGASRWDRQPDAILVTADLLWWGPDLVDRIRAGIAGAHGLDPDRLVLHASHTHCAPMPGTTCSPLLGAYDQAYLDLLVERMVFGIGEVLEEPEEVTLHRARAEARISINRRRANPDGSVGGADPAGPVDNEVVVLAFRRADGSDKAVLVHHTCHPVVSDARQVSPDYPGAMRDHLDPRPTVGFLQGCCGDVNPRVLRDGELARGGELEIAELGGRLADAVQSVLSGVLEPSGASGLQPSRVLEPLAVPEVRVRRGRSRLPMHVPSRHQLAKWRDEPGILGDWARHLLATGQPLPSESPLHLTALELGESLALLGFDAEVTVPYGLWVKQTYAGDVLPLGYTDGMIGYVPTAEQILAGGYEPDESYPYIYRAGRFAPEVEQVVRSGIVEFVGR